ncbi:hypothetical protein TNCV_363421 [Trichonephila clavipes]|nr:hypothetical protein TNCV_363421 [Trichonephila clavipes]
MMRVIDFKNLILALKDYDEQFTKTLLKTIIETRVQEERDEKEESEYKRNQEGLTLEQERMKLSMTATSTNTSAAAADKINIQHLSYPDLWKILIFPPILKYLKGSDCAFSLSRRQQRGYTAKRLIPGNFEETEINKPEVSVDALEELLEHIKIYSEDLNAINTEIENAVDITELDNELKSATEYRDKIITWTFRAGKKIRELSKNNSTEISTTSKVAPEECPDHYKETALTLLESFYVDNLVCSVNSKEKLDKLIVESQEILEEGKFELRGWEHNNLDPQTENTVPTERRSVLVLGLKWDLDQDLLSVDIKVHESKNEILTKKEKYYRWYIRYLTLLVLLVR